MKLMKRKKSTRFFIKPMTTIKAATIIYNEKNTKINYSSGSALRAFNVRFPFIRRYDSCLFGSSSLIHDDATRTLKINGHT